jgi:antirestriction protein ArdC
MKTAALALALTMTALAAHAESAFVIELPTAAVTVEDSKWAFDSTEFQVEVDYIVKSFPELVQERVRAALTADAATNVWLIPMPRDELHSLYEAQTDSDDKVGAFYDPSENAIYIAPNEDQLMYSSTVLHELVHYVQYALDMDEFVKCEAELERTAYRIQRDYLIDNGRSNADAMVKDLGLYEIVLSRCPRDF